MDIKKIKWLKYQMHFKRFRNIHKFVTFKKVIVTLLSLIIALTAVILFSQNHSVRQQNALYKIQECNLVKNYTNCVKEYLKPLISNSGPGEILNYIKSNSIATPYNLNNNIECHDFAHILGSVAGEYTTDIATTLEKCGQDCYSGCYHGFFEGIQKNIKYKSVNLDNICITTDIGDNNKISGCLHALGHYYMELSSNRLVEGFDKCINLQTTVDFQKYCLSGAFMEAELRGENRQMPLTIPKLPTPETYKSFCTKFNEIISEYCLQEGGMYIYRMTLDPKISANFCIQDVRDADVVNCLHALGGFFHRKQPANYIEYLVHNCNLEDQKYSLSCLQGGAESISLGGQSVEELISMCIRKKVVDSEKCKSLSTK